MSGIQALGRSRQETVNWHLPALNGETLSPKFPKGVGEITQLLRVLATPHGSWVQFLAPTLVSSQLPGIPAPGDLMPGWKADMPLLKFLALSRILASEILWEINHVIVWATAHSCPDTKAVAPPLWEQHSLEPALRSSRAWTVRELSVFIFSLVILVIGQM